MEDSPPRVSQFPGGVNSFWRSPPFICKPTNLKSTAASNSPTGSQYFLCLKSTRASTRQARTASCPDPARLPHTSQSFLLPAVSFHQNLDHGSGCPWLLCRLTPSGASSPPRGPAWPASHRWGSRVMSTLSCDDIDLSVSPLSQLYKLRPGHTSHSQDRGPRVRLGSGEVVVKAVRPEEPA